jgi:hypothetical protein
VLPKAISTQATEERVMFAATGQTDDATMSTISGGFDD